MHHRRYLQEPTKQRRRKRKGVKNGKKKAGEAKDNHCKCPVTAILLSLAANTTLTLWPMVTAPGCPPPKKCLCLLAIIIGAPIMIAKRRKHFFSFTTLIPDDSVKLSCITGIPPRQLCSSIASRCMHLLCMYGRKLDDLWNKALSCSKQLPQPLQHQLRSLPSARCACRPASSAILAAPRGVHSCWQKSVCMIVKCPACLLHW